MRRFYKTVSVAGDGSILLDGKPILTPAKARLALPTLKLADAIAAEWREQGADIQPATMHLTRLANTAIDRTEARRDEVAAELVNFARSDLLCYRAIEPADLIQRQKAAWDPLLDWVDASYGVRFRTTEGIGHVQQDAQVISVLNEMLIAKDAWSLTAMHAATTSTGSLILALAMSEDRLSPQEAFAISRVDETFQADKWGLDAEAETRARLLLGELEMAGRFMALLKP